MAKLPEIREQTLNLEVTVTFCWWARACFAVAVWLLRLAGTRGITGECAKKRFPLFRGAITEEAT